MLFLFYSHCKCDVLVSLNIIFYLGCNSDKLSYKLFCAFVFVRSGIEKRFLVESDDVCIQYSYFCCEFIGWHKCGKTNNSAKRYCNPLCLLDSSLVS